MAGVNTFIDHDLSRSHTRIGVGAEYWRDYLKLSANGYIRASGWKKSPDIEDYQERPANGWDIRAEGYLPAWPQLGASLMYEQYPPPSSHFLKNDASQNQYLTEYDRLYDVLPPE